MQRRKCFGIEERSLHHLDGFPLGLGDFLALTTLNGPWEVCNWDDEE